MPESVSVVPPRDLYKWARIWGSVQKRYYKEPVDLRREKQIRDFVTLNQWKKPMFVKDTDVFIGVEQVHDVDKADIVVITDQRFSRYPCTEMIRRITQWLRQCPDLILCLNRHYINIDHAFQDACLDDNYNTAICQWLRQQLPDSNILDLSLDYTDRGDWFTWVIPDRIFYINHEAG